MIRTTAPVEGQPPYNWNVPSAKQCTWFAYFRAIENSQTFPCWFDRSTQTGSYTNAKLWLENWREPWEVKGSDFKPSAGDIAVFDGEYGHVIYIEQVNGNVALISDYNRVAPLTYASDTWEVGTRLKGCGDLLGYLHFPYEEVNPVERDESKNQIQTTDETLRIRNKPSLSGDIVGHVQIGYYDVLSQSDADGYTWYQIAPNRWCADITTNYLPSSHDDIIKQIEKYFNDMKAQVNNLKDENSELKMSMKQINDITEKWAG